MAETFERIQAAEGDLLTYIKKGVLYIEKKPHYIVELIREPDLAYVMVYKVHPGTDDNPKKLAVKVSKPQHSFVTSTVLGMLASKMIPNKMEHKWVPKDPVFVAPVIPNGYNTFTNKREDGFFEREEDRVAVEAGEKKLYRGRNTGVFIGLSSIIWEDKMTIPTESLVKTLTAYKDEMFYDLQGNNNDRGNALSTYYKGGNE